MNPSRFSRQSLAPLMSLAPFARHAALLMATLATSAVVHAQKPTDAGKACPPPAAAPTAAQQQAAKSNAKDRGPLWRISKGGRSSYLYGTMHVGKLEWINPGPALQQALKASDTLALELDAEDPNVQRQIAQAMMRPSPALPNALEQRMRNVKSTLCIPTGAMDTMHPIMQVTLFSLLAAQWDGLHGAFGSERMLTAAAKAAGKRVTSLETVQTQMDALLFSQDPQELQALMASALEQHEKQQVRPGLQRMMNIWEAGDNAAMENYEQWCDCIKGDADRALYKRINDARNPGMADSIDALHQQGRSVLAAVGALHMTGTAALPKLMTERGYTVDRVR
jgi:uncharacterized protein